MKKLSRNGNNWLILLMLFMAACGKKNAVQQQLTVNQPTLPYMGPHIIQEREENGVLIIDTIYHTIPPFSFIDQDGNIVTEKTVEGKVYIADFFFTTCPSICPKMGVTLQLVQEKLKNEPQFMILSHSIDPEHDNPAVLKEYAKKLGANEHQWKFLTGNRDSIYTICEESYMAFAYEDANAEGGYLHSGFLVLVDQNRHIRGAYDGTRPEITDSIVADVKRLLKK
ncbi:MAG: SCO family protein [Flavobacteriales bacterium]|nr:SCO family protein [Flavobacteriales bacterium]